MSTAVCTSIPPPGLSLAQRRHNRDSNSAGAPLPKLPRRASASSASRTAAGARLSASASAVSEKTSKSDFVSSASGTPTHAASTTSTPFAPAAVVVQPPTPPQPAGADKGREGMTNQDACASDSSTSSDGSQIIVASPRGNRTRGQRAPSPSPCVSVSDNVPASSAPFKFPNLPAGSTTSSAMRPTDSSAQPARSRHQHSFSLDPASVAIPNAGRSASETPLAIRGNNKTCRPLKSSLKMRSQSQCGDISVFIPNTTSKSAPATPKAVHFDSQLERVKLFISKQKPSAVSRDGSPTDDTSGTETGDWPSFIFGGASAKASDTDRARKNITMNVSHFPDATLRRHEDVALERLSLASDASAINGQVRVRNLAFDKVVIARFTFDDWQTTSEVSMRYVDSFDHGAYDRFSFTIRLNDMLSRIEEKTFYLALKYIVAGREIWDNNGGRNYQAKFVRKPLPNVKSQSQAPQRLQRSIRRRAVAKPLSDEDVADLTGKLQEVARLSGSESPITTAEGDQSPTPFDRSNADEQFSFKSDPLATRYDFAASARQPWRPAEHQRVPRTSPGQTRNDAHSHQTGHSVIRKSIADAFSGRSNTLPSPRVANEDIESALVSPRKYAGYDDEDDGSCRSNRAQHRRNHQRGYFDLQPQSFSLGPQFNLRRTQPGSPEAANSTLAALARFNSFPQTAAEESRSASASPAGTPGVSNSEAAPAPAGDAGPGLASGEEVVAPVPGKAMSMLRPAWDSLLVFPGGSEDSTPSITSGESSRSNSPTPSPDEFAADMFARPAPERVTSPANESYSAFLNRFCFFTGPGASHTLSETQRSHSASNLEEYFSTIASRSSHSWNGALTPRDMPSRPSSADSVRTAGSGATLNQ